MPATLQDKARTRAFARVIGPFLVIVPSAVAFRAATGTLEASYGGFFEQPLLVWFAATLLLFGGLMIIAHHQIWSSPAAILISLFGWFLLLRGVALIAVPQLMQQGVQAGMNLLPAVIAGFSALALIGLYLTYVGYIAKQDPAS